MICSRRVPVGSAGRHNWSIGPLYLTIIGLLSLALAQQPVLAETYYLDASSGDDSYDGLAAAYDGTHGPWKTLARTYSWYAGQETPKVQEGDTVYLRTGQYGAFEENTNNGQSYLFYRTDWITYAAAPGHTPVFDRIYLRNEDKWNGGENGQSRLIFDGIQVTDGVGLQATSYVTLRNCTIRRIGASCEGLYAPYVKPMEDCVSARDVTNFTLDSSRCENGNRLIYLYDVRDCAITGNVLTRSSEDGIKFAIAENLRIENNHIHDIDHRRGTFDLYGSSSGGFVSGERVVQDGTNAEGVAWRWVESG